VSHERGVCLLLQEFACILPVLLGGQDVIKKSQNCHIEKNREKDIC